MTHSCISWIHFSSKSRSSVHTQVKFQHILSNYFEEHILVGKDFQIKIKHFIYTDQYLVAFGLVSEVYFSGGLCKADKWFIFIWKSLVIIKQSTFFPFCIICSSIKRITEIDFIYCSALLIIIMGAGKQSCQQGPLKHFFII